MDKYTASGTIRVSERIAENLATRRAADELLDFALAAPHKTVVVDFNSVKFAGRSFVHEYLMRKNGIDKVIVEKNMSIPVSKMFRFVSKESAETPVNVVTSFKSISLSAKSL